MVGYSSESKAYRFYDPKTRNVSKSRDVQFLENSINIGQGKSKVLVLMDLKDSESKGEENFQNSKKYISYSSNNSEDSFNTDCGDDDNGIGDDGDDADGDENCADDWCG